MLTLAELRELAASIARDGLLHPCVRKGGVLLDGRNRLLACDMAGVEPRFAEYDGDSPVAFIIGANLARRHLDKGQKVALAVDLEPYFAAEAKKRQQEHGGTAPGRRKSLKDNVPEVRPAPQSRDLAAAAVGVSGKLVSAAKALKEADPERFEQVKQGKLSVAKAKREIKAERPSRPRRARRRSLHLRHTCGGTLAAVHARSFWRRTCNGRGTRTYHRLTIAMQLAARLQRSSWRHACNDHDAFFRSDSMRIALMFFPTDALL